MTAYSPTCTWQRLPLEGAVNVRDIGGYPARGGAVTAYGCFVRSDSLRHLTQADEDFLYNYGVRTVIDLRDADEVEREPDKLIQRKDVSYMQVSLLGGNMADPRYLRTLDTKLTPQNVYRFAVDNTEAMAKIFRTMAHAAPGCILFHCAIGKDRTGIVAMLLMRLAGCDVYDCLANYVVSEINLRRDEIYVGMYASAPEWERPFLESRVEFLQDVMDYLDANYPSVEDYLLALGLTSDEVERLRDRVLGKAS